MVVQMRVRFIETLGHRPGCRTPKGVGKLQPKNAEGTLENFSPRTPKGRRKTSAEERRRRWLIQAQGWSSDNLGLTKHKLMINPVRVRRPLRSLEPKLRPAQLCFGINFVGTLARRREIKSNTVPG
jgi:hypothetical protein